MDEEYDNKCIICFEDKSTTNPLMQANEIFVTKCGCKYFLHKECMEEWRKTKKKNFMCVNCNSPAKLKNNSVVIEIDSPESDPIDRAIEQQLIIAQQRNQPRTIGEIYCPQCPEIQSICCIWVFVLFVLLIILL